MWTRICPKTQNISNTCVPVRDRMLLNTESYSNEKGKGVSHAKIMCKIDW